MSTTRENTTSVNFGDIAAHVGGSGVILGAAYLSDVASWVSALIMLIVFNGALMIGHRVRDL